MHSQARSSTAYVFAIAFFAGALISQSTAVDASFQQGTTTSPLIETAPGVFYATIPTNGAYGHGSILRITSGGSFTLAYNFGGGGNTLDGLAPENVMLGQDGELYGITAVGGNTTLNCGTIFEFILQSSSLSTLHRFGTGEGCHGIGGLYFGFGQGGLRTLYGTTGSVGTHGTIYSLDFFGTYTTLHTFGTSHDGDLPNSSLVLIDQATGDLASTTLQGGAYGFGTLYELQFHALGAPTESVVYSFPGVSQLNNQSPQGPIASGNDAIFGNIPGYGPTTNGLLYTFTFSNQFIGEVTIVPGYHLFGACSGVSLGSDGNYYGATCSAGTHGLGFVYRFNPRTTIYSVLHSFIAADGITPETPPIFGSDGNLYGTTAQDGQFGLGTIYKLTPAGALTVLHSFTSTD